MRSRRPLPRPYAAAPRLPLAVYTVFLFVQHCVNGTFLREVWYAQPSCGLVGALWQLQTIATPCLCGDGLV